MQVDWLLYCSKLGEAINQAGGIYISDNAMVAKKAVVNLTRHPSEDSSTMIVDSETGPLLRNIKPFAPYDFTWLFPFEPQRAKEVRFAGRDGSRLPGMSKARLGPLTASVALFFSTLMLTVSKLLSALCWVAGIRPSACDGDG